MNANPLSKEATYPFTATLEGRGKVECEMWEVIEGQIEVAEARVNGLPVTLTEMEEELIEIEFLRAERAAREG